MLVLLEIWKDTARLVIWFAVKYFTDNYQAIIMGRLAGISVASKHIELIKLLIIWNMLGN